VLAVRLVLSASIIIIVLIAGCTRSLVYSPSMNLPPQPLKQKEAQVLGGVGFFPETRPHLVEHKSAFGTEGTFRLAFCDHITLQGKYWHDLSDNLDDNRYGLSFSMIAAFADSTSLRFGLIPTAAFASGNGDFQGGGGGMFLALWYSGFSPITIYGTLGPAFGIRVTDEEESKWGWGLLINTGIAALIKKHLTINVELAGIKQENKYDHKTEYFLCPSINIGYLFTEVKKKPRE